MNYNYLQLPQKGSSALSINFSDIIYLEGDSNYTVFHMVGGSKITSSRTMLFHIQNYLNEGFLRIHKAYCVNRDFIKSYDYYNDPEYIFLQNGTTLKVARRKQQECRLNLS